MTHTRKGDIALSCYPRDLVLSLTTACNQICRFCSGVHDKATEADCSPDAFIGWNHEHMQFIRRTVNSEEVLANKMCSFCRLMNKLEKGADMRKAALGDILRVSPDGFFPPVHLE